MHINDKATDSPRWYRYGYHSNKGNGLENVISIGIVECVLKAPLFVHVSTRLSTRFKQNLNLWSKPNREWDQFYWSMYPPPFEAQSLCSNQNPNITLASHCQPLLPPHLPHLHRRSHPPWVHPALPPSQTPAASVLLPAVFQAWG